MHAVEQIIIEYSSSHHVTSMGLGDIKEFQPNISAHMLLHPLNDTTRLQREAANSKMQLWFVDTKHQNKFDLCRYTTRHREVTADIHSNAMHRNL
ncbi:hypothetical protein EJB05_26372, partial [Eragrostis curvula]